MKVLKFFLIFLVFFSCKKEEKVISNNYAKEAYEIIHRERPDIPILLEDVEMAMRVNSASPCTWDFNYDGLISNQDLLVFLSRYGTDYDITDLLNFLSAFGEEYIVDVIPAWLNFIQDNTFAVPSFSKVLCNGEIVITTLASLPTTNFNQTRWYYEDELIGMGDSLKIQTYGQDGQITNPGWQGPCDGTKPITLEITHNGKVFSRTVNSRISTANYPDTIPTCEELLGLGLFDAILANSSYVGIPLIPYQFCINCN